MEHLFTSPPASTAVFTTVVGSPCTSARERDVFLEVPRAPVLLNNLRQCTLTLYVNRQEKGPLKCFVQGVLQNARKMSDD